MCSVCLSVKKLARALHAPTAFNSKRRYQKLAIAIRVLQSTEYLVISRCCFAEDGKEMYQDSKRTCTVIVLLIRPFVWCRYRHRRRRGLGKTPYCSVRDWTRFLRHRIKKYPDSPVHTLSDSLRIYFFPLWRAYLSFYGFAVEFAGYVWTVAVSGTKKLRIRKYPDTCGRGLRLLVLGSLKCPSRQNFYFLIWFYVSRTHR